MFKSFDGGNMAYQGNAMAFRDLDEELLKSLQLGREFEDLLKNFPNRGNERVLDQFYPEGASVNLQFMKINEKDLVDFLLCVLRQNCQTITLHDEEYSVQCLFKNKTESAAVDIFLSRVDENVIAIEFKKVTGNTGFYHK